MLKNLCFHICICIILSACSTTAKPPSSELNVSMERQPASFDKPGESVSKEDNKVVVPSNLAIEWQKYFQPDPSASERKRIGQKLEKWKDVSTASDLVKRAQNEAVLGRFAAAEVTLQQATRLEPDNGDSWIELAKLALRKRDPSRSLEYLAVVKKIIDRNEDLNGELVFRYKYILSLSYISSGDREKGHGVLSELIAIDKSFIPAYSALATSYLNQGKLDMAKFIAQRGLDRGPEDANILNVLGIVAQKQGKLAAAKSFFESSLKKNPDYGPALINSANLQIRNFEYEAAELALQKAISINPDSSSAYVAMSILQRKTGRKEAAIESLQKAIDLDPGNGNARFNLAMIKMQDKTTRSNDALRLLIEVTQTDQSDEQLKNLAQFYIEGIQEDRAH